MFYPRRIIQVVFLASLVTAGGCKSDRLDLTQFLPVQLDNLVVEGAKTSLNPSFNPSTSRYSIIAQDPISEVVITPFASDTMKISVNGQLISSGVAMPQLNLMVGDTVQIKIQPAAPGRSDERVYEIVYLPPNFPELVVTAHEVGASQDPLYVTFQNPNASFIAILDNNGVPMFYREEVQRVFDFKWHEATGERSYSRFTGDRNQWGRRNTEEVVLDQDFNEIGRFSTIGLSHTDAHDFLLTGANEMIFLSYDGVLRDLTAFGQSDEELIEDSVVQVVDRATMQVMFEWRSWDHVPYEDQIYDPPRGEYVHANSVFVDTDGNFLLSARGSSQAIKIARPSGQVMWKLGGKSNQFEFINDPYSQICGQHTVTRLDSGNILLFDNGQNCWPQNGDRGELTRVVEYKLDEQNLTAELVWSYTQDGNYTRSQGSAQRLANGNTLIGWGRGPDELVTEVDSSGNKVFEISATLNGTTVFGYRAFRFAQ